MDETTKLTLILPNLAPIIEQKLNNELLSDTLKKIINKGSFQANNIGLERSLFNHFGSKEIEGTDLPMAALRHPGMISLCADPCYLYADRDQLILFSDQLDITQQETEIFIKAIQPLLTEYGGVLTADDSEHWALFLPVVPDLTFTALPDVKGKSINDKLLKGTDQKDWLRLWNEIQMLLFDLPINQQRISVGKLPINSLWLWGKGEFSAKDDCWRSTMGQDVFLGQLSEITNVSHHVNIDDLLALSAGEHLIVSETLDLENDWQHQLHQIEQELLQPLWQCLRRYKLSSVTIEIPNYGQYHLKPFDSWKFW